MKIASQPLHRLVEGVLRITWNLPLACALFASNAEAKDLGVMGHVFPIQEENLVLFLQKQFSQNFSDHSFHNILKALEEKAKHPKPIELLSEAKEPRIFYYDPSYLVKETIKDHRERVIIAKGTLINPLQKIRLPSGLLFFDGTNQAHIQWARKQQGVFKWILVRGNPFEMEDCEKRPIYFDQNASLTKKLNFLHIPAKVTQEGALLKIEELPIDSKGDAK